MAENDAEKNQPPTQKRLDEARKKGQVPRSQELSAAAVVMASGGALQFLGRDIGDGLFDMMRAGLSISREQATDTSYAISMFAAASQHALMSCAPLFGLTMAAALLAPMSIGGWNLAFGKLAPDFSRLSPIQGLGRVFSMRSLVELIKAFAKFGVMAVIAVIFLKLKTKEMLGLGMEPTAAGVGHAVTLSGQALMSLSAGLVLIAAIDVPFQLYQHIKSLKMTREEVREEMKESEGNPEVKGKIRQLQQEVARRRQMTEVPKADVVITNPTHFAVALRYDEKRMRAPIVVAKGVDEVAAKIREIAGQHNVPLFEAPPLARALFRAVDLNEPVPAKLYVAVAQVLTYVYQLRAVKKNGGDPPTRPLIDPVVEDVTKH